MNATITTPCPCNNTGVVLGEFALTFCQCGTRPADTSAALSRLQLAQAADLAETAAVIALRAAVGHDADADGAFEHSARTYALAADGPDGISEDVEAWILARFDLCVHCLKQAAWPEGHVRCRHGVEVEHAS